MLPAQPNQSLIDGLACLQALASQEEAIGSRELARQLDLEPTRINRLLRTLAHLGLAEQDRRRKYRVGPGIHVLAAQSLFGSGLLRRAIEPLESLHGLGHIVAMGVLWRDQTCYLYHANPSAPVAHGLGHERLFPAAASGLGLALLARKPDDEVRTLYDHTHPDPEDPSFDVDALLTRLEQVRERGYALATIQRTGSRTIGIGLGQPPYAAIGLSGRFADADIPHLVAALREVADQIERIEETP